MGGELFFGRGGGGSERVVMQVAACDGRQPFVEQTYERADHSGLGLAPLAEEDHIVARQQSVLQRGDDGLLVAEHIREDGAPLSDGCDEVAADFFFDRRRLPARCFKRAEGGRQIGRGLGGCKRVGYELVGWGCCLFGLRF